MPILTIPETDLVCHLVAFDATGRERTDDPDGPMSQRITAVLGAEPVTDIFVMSHGWKGDVPAAREQYVRWVRAMRRCGRDVERMQRARRPFRPLLVGLHWPSLPWGDESLGPDGAVSFDGPQPMAELVDAYAERLADTPAARAALVTILEAALEDIAPPTLPAAVRQAYEVLDREAALGEDGIGGAPGADREPFDPERAFQDAQDEAASFGEVEIGGILSPLRQLSFWKMKDRARRFGEGGAFMLLRELQKSVGAQRRVRIHLMGHSFGCIVVSAMLAGPGGRGELDRPVDSVTLVQGALSLWSYCASIPRAAGRAGYFHSIVAPGKVDGPIVTTQSEHDTAVRRLYPIGAGAARQVAFAPGELPKYGGLGTFGARGPGVDIVDLVMGNADAPYEFAPGKIYNVEASDFIREGTGLAGAHNDIARPEVAHVVWEAALR